MSSTPRIDWSHVPVVYVAAPACCHCAATDYRTIRSEANGDGSTTRKAKCNRCGRPFKISIELPEIGKQDPAG